MCFMQLIIFKVQRYAEQLYSYASYFNISLDAVCFLLLIYGTKLKYLNENNSLIATLSVGR